MNYCKIKGTEYDGWVGVINGVVSDTAAQGTVLSVSVTPTADDLLTEVYLPAAVVVQVRV